jgi:hypothetical protein
MTEHFDPGLSDDTAAYLALHRAPKWAVGIRTPNDTPPKEPNHDNPNPSA